MVSTEIQISQMFVPSEFKIYLQQLPNKFQKIVPTIEKEMAQDLALRIKRRAPPGVVDSLRKQIKAEFVGKGSKKGWRIVGPAHWRYVNSGQSPKPGLYIPYEAILMHYAKPGDTAGKKLKNIIPNPELGWFSPAEKLSGKRGKGFFDRAMEKFDQEIVPIIERGINKAFQK